MNSFYQFIHGNYGYLINGIVIVFCVLVFAFINMYMYGAVRSAYQRARLQLINAMQRNSGHNVFSYNYQAQRLNRLGVTYYSHGRVTPTVYLSYKIAALAAGFAVGMMFNPLIGVIFAFLGYIIPDKVIEQRNREDNQKMLGSIMNIYDVMLLQINSGE